MKSSVFRSLDVAQDLALTHLFAALQRRGLPSSDDMVDAASTAEFVYHFYSRILADPIVDGHNRVLLAYMGLGTWNGRDCLEEGKKCDSLYPDAECELGSTWVDSTGKVYGQIPSENGKAPPLTNYRLPCIRDLHHGRRGGGEVETEGDREATSSDGVFR